MLAVYSLIFGYQKHLGILKMWMYYIRVLQCIFKINMSAYLTCIPDERTNAIIPMHS